MIAEELSQALRESHLSMLKLKVQQFRKWIPDLGLLLILANQHRQETHM